VLWERRSRISGKVTIIERGSTGGRIRLTVVAAIDYPEATEILVSFPNKWEFVDQICREDEVL
jgi:hypothetical protein